MEAADYEQDLLLDLLRRSPAFDPGRASFPTFADRLIRHRASTLRTETEARKAERSMVSLDEVVIDEDGGEHRLIDVLPDEQSLTEENLGLIIDIRRFVGRLGTPEQQGCELLTADNISEAAQRARINRSTAYERIHRLRAKAIDEGLGCYVSHAPNSAEGRAVSDEEAGVDAGLLEDNHAGSSMPRPILRPRLQVTDEDLREWLRAAPAGDCLEYFRGFLIADRAATGSRLPPDARNELVCIAGRARSASDEGLVHLVQHRYGHCDYGYRIVVRPRSQVVP
jgi:RNA polymerase sigma-70 factor (ECF subfamily)